MISKEKRTQNKNDGVVATGMARTRHSKGTRRGNNMVITNQKNKQRLKKEIQGADGVTPGLHLREGKTPSPAAQRTEGEGEDIWGGVFYFELGGERRWGKRKDWKNYFNCRR